MRQKISAKKSVLARRQLASWVNILPGMVLLCLSILSVSTFLAPTQASAQTRSLKLYYTHTKERATITFKKNGRYDQAGLKKLNRFLRDWRRNEPTKMDPKLFDVLWEVYRKSGAKNYIHVVSAYRSPATNEMLRKTRGGQASKSQHMYGRAIDFFIPGVKTSKLREIGMKLQGGGVGYYPRSATPFVHLDVASVRAWPRMSRSELVKLFPNGKTLHLPPDGKPLPGYNVALAEYKRRKGAITSSPATKSEPTRTVVAKAEPKTDDGNARSGNLFTNLFNRNRNNDDQTVTPAPSAPAQERTVVASLPQTALNEVTLPRDNIPVPVLSFTASQTDALRPGLDNGIEQEQNPLLGSPDTDDPIAETLVASLPAPANGGNVPVLAYQDPVRTVQPESFAAIMSAAIETDRQRKLNGEAANPIVAGAVRPEPQRVDIAALHPPQLRAHNKLSRSDFGQIVTNAARKANSKSARPNLRDAMARGLKAKTKEPDLKQIQVSQRALSKQSIVNMRPPVTSPGFVSNIMRKPPAVVYTKGFSVDHKVRQNHNNFGGNAVSFLPVIRYNG